MTTPSRRIATRALHLPVADGDFVASYIVGSGSEPGKVYHVDARLARPLGEPCGWACDCVAPGACAHVYAVLAHRDPAVRRMLRRIAAGRPVAAPVEVAS